MGNICATKKIEMLKNKKYIALTLGGIPTMAPSLTPPPLIIIPDRTSFRGPVGSTTLLLTNISKKDMNWKPQHLV